MLPDDKQALLQALAEARAENARLQRALDASEAHSQALLDSIGDSIFIVDAATGEIANANSHAARRLGYAWDEMLGMPIAQIEIHNGSGPSSAAAWQSEVSGTRVYECYHQRKDGVRVPVEVSRRVVDLGTQKITHLVARCISRRKEQEQEREQMHAQLREGLELFRVFVHQSNDGVIIVNEGGTIIEWNSAMSGISGLTREQVLQQSALSILGQVIQRSPGTEHQEGLAFELAQALTGADTSWFGMPGEHIIYHQDGSPRTLLSVVFPIDTANGRLLGAILRDITARKREQQREFDLSLERERRSILEGFITNSSHEFRTPLANIGLYAHLIARLDDPQARAQRAALIQSEVKRIQQLVDQSMQIVQLNHLTPRTEASTDVAPLFETVCRAFIARYPDRPRLRYQRAPGLPSIQAEADYLHEMITQLLHNAYHHTPDDTRIEASLALDEDSIRLEIRDNGPGISHYALPRIFEAFWRADTAHTTAGLGLGLTIVRLIVERFNGQIVVESEPDQGTTVIVWLPVAGTD